MRRKKLKRYAKILLEMYSNNVLPIFKMDFW